MSKFHTPTKSKLQRMCAIQEQEGLLATPTPRIKRQGKSEDHDSLLVPLQPPTQPPPPKTIFLIRHGQSLGQVAKYKIRQTDVALTDCGLTGLGREQASNIRELLKNEEPIQLVVTSPLTRAMHTTCLAFGGDEVMMDTEDTEDIETRPPPSLPLPILCHYHLREVGSMIPENIPRPMAQVLRDLRTAGVPDHVVSRIDTTSLRPESWPHRHDTPPRVVRRDRIGQVLQWLAMARTETCIAVVCHYHVIRAALHDPYYVPTRGNTRGAAAAAEDIQPVNGCPIKCHLCPVTGRLTLAVPTDMDCS
jgi:broad specificity phosphatase PhoE